MTGNNRERSDGFEREELVHAVRSREHFLSEVLGSLESFVTIDEDWRFTFVNEAAAEFAETSSAELLGQDLRQFPAAAGFPEVLALLQRAMSEGIRVEFDLDDPSWRHCYRGSADPLKDGGLAIYVRDVTERKRLEAEFARQQEELRLLVRHAATGIHEIDFRGPRFVSVNDFMCSYSGYSREELLATNPLDLLDEESQTRFRERIAKLLSGEPVDAQVEYCFLMKHGEKRYAVLNITPTFEAGRPVGAFVVGQDVTERKRAEEALRASEERLRRIARAGRIGFVEWNAATDTAYWSPEHYELFGFEPGSQISWQRWLEGVHPDDRERLEANAAQLLERGAAEGHVRDHRDEYRFVRPDGSVVWIEADMSVDMIDGQAVVRGVVRDVTERKEAEQRVRESTEQNGFLLLLTDALRPLDDAVAIQETASRVLGEHLGADRVGYFEVEGDDCVIERDWAPSVPHLCGRFPVAAFGDGLMGVCRSGRMVVMNDVAEEPFAPQEREAYEAIQVAAQISMPLVKNGKFIGGLTVHSAAPRAWTLLEVRLLEETAERTWAAVERARAESELREGEERYRQLFESESDALFLIDQETGRIIDANAAAAETYGYELAELLTLADVDLSIEPESTRDAAHPAAVGEQVRVPMRRHRRKDGSAFFVEITGRIFSLRGRPVRIAAVRDVTERIRKEEALRESEELYRSILRASPDDITVTDLQGRILLVSPAATSMLGYGREEDLLGRSMLEFLVPEDRARAEASIALMHEGVFSGPGEYAAVHADGSAFPIEVNGEFIKDADGRPTGMVFVVRDVTARKQAEEALRESESRFDSLFESSPDAVFLTMPDGAILAANPAACSLYGWSEDEFREKGRSVLFEPGDPRLADVLEERRRTGRLRGVQLLAVRKNGERFPIELDSVILPGDPERAFVIVRDITERELAERALRESEAERAAHEERSRLARDLHDSVTQALFAATLKAEALILASGEEAPATAAAAEDVRRLNRGALAQMRTMLLELRGDPLEDVPLRQLLTNAVEAAETRIGTRIALTLDDAGPLPAKVHEAVYRITLEALNNVVRHAKAQHASVELDADCSRARLVISDDGCGFDPEAVDLSHLGLTSMRERAFLAGADLLVQSAPGAGALIQVDWEARRTPPSGPALT